MSIWRVTTIVTLCAFAATSAAAEPVHANRKRERLYQRGRVETYIGMGLAAMGAALIAGAPEDNKRGFDRGGDRTRIMGGVFVLSGAAVGWLGVHHKRMGQPATSVGVRLIGERAVVLRRSW